MDSSPRPNRRLIITNALIVGLIGAAFGFATQNILPWLIGGVLIGVLLVFASTPFFRRFKRLNRCRLLIMVFVEVLLTVYVVIPLYGGYTYTHPIRFPIMITPAEVGLTYDNISLTTDDGVKLSGWYVPSRNSTAIIAVHGFNGNRTQMLYYAQALAQHGYGVLMFDMRAHGESGGDRFGNSWNSDLDMLAAIDYLQHRSDVQADRIGALGLSSGAHTIIYGAARSDRIRALIADGTGGGRHEDFVDPFIPEAQGVWFMAPMNWMLDRMTELFCGCAANVPIKEAVKHIAPRPIMFIAAGQSPYEISFAQRYAASAGPNAIVWELSDAGHVGGFMSHHDEYVRRMIEFFDANLLK